MPYVYTKTDKKTSTKSIYGHNVIRKKFKNYFEYKKFQEDNDCEENKVMPEIQFLAEHYHKIPDDDLEVPNLKIYSLDIETYSFEFPSPKTAPDPIVLISLYDMDTSKIYVFGSKQYTDTELDENITYYHYSDEKELLTNFVEFIHNSKPDVITGWNIIPATKLNVSGFDMGYIVNRIRNLFGTDTDLYKKLSPIKQVTTREDRDGNIHVDIAGITLIDYLTAYKWYSRENPESYTLEYVSNLELGTGKLQYEGSLHELYENNYNKMVDYNIIDTKRVKQLEDKLSFIKLIQTI
ncbi:MAG: 3'-5' exonuclease, partial [bacterium]